MGLDLMTRTIQVVAEATAQPVGDGQTVQKTSEMNAVRCEATAHMQFQLRYMFHQVPLS